MNFTMNLKQVMRDKNIEEAKIAELLRLDDKGLAALWRGKYFPSREAILQLAGALGISVEALLPHQEMLTQSDAQTCWIMAITFDRKTMAHCYYLDAYHNPNAKPDEPGYTLYGIDTQTQEKLLLGYYQSRDNLAKDLRGLVEGLLDPDKIVYELQHQSKVKKTLFKVKLTDSI